MLTFDVDPLSKSQRPTGLWAASLVHALARDEAAGRRSQRLTEPDLATWKRFRGRLNATDLVALLFEDAAVLHQVPFSPSHMDESLRLQRLPSELAAAWLGAIKDLDLSANGREYIDAQAKFLGLPTRMARADLHVIKPHHKVLELPGTGGQLAHHLTSSQDDIALHDNFRIACCSWQELTLAGIIGLDLGAPHSNYAVKVEVGGMESPDHSLRQRSFDFVIGLSPDKGGLFQIQDQLAVWFSGAKIFLV